MVNLEDTGGPNGGSTGLGKGDPTEEPDGKKEHVSARRPEVGYRSDLK